MGVFCCQRACVRAHRTVFRMPMMTVVAHAFMFDRTRVAEFWHRSLNLAEDPAVWLADVEGGVWFADAWDRHLADWVLFMSAPCDPAEFVAESGLRFIFDATVEGEGVTLMPVVFEVSNAELLTLL